MKIKILCIIAAATLIAGCAETRKHAGASAENDQNVLTGGRWGGWGYGGMEDAMLDGKAAAEQILKA